MNRLAILGTGCLFAASVAAVAAPRAVVPRFDALHKSSSASGEAEITQERMKAHVTWLASDENRGRNTGGGVLEGRVAEYLEAEMRACGLAPRGDAAGTTYRQPFTASPWRGKKGEHDAHREPGNPEDYGVKANQYGLALDAKGQPVTVETLSPDTIAETDPSAAKKTFNLVGFLEGRDPVKKNEIVVFGAHMDHIGERSMGGGDRIFNGADDNGTGSTALLTMCRALAKDREIGNGPARSVLICFFSGEELGLLGSQFFVGSPTVEFSKIKSMLNIDMIGRAQAGAVSVCDDTDSSGPNHFHALHDTASTGLASVKHDINGFLRRSDQYPFFRKGVPIIFFFEGFEANGRMNADYHGLGDHVNKLDIPKMVDITKFAYRHLLGAANL